MTDKREEPCCVRTKTKLVFCKGVLELIMGLNLVTTKTTIVKGSKEVYHVSFALH